MATKKIYDLAVVTGSYNDRQTGKDKNRYQTVGAMLEKDDGGKFIILERWFNPAGVQFRDGSSSITLSMFEPRDHNNAGQAQQSQQEQQQARPQQQAAAPAASDFDEDIPF